MALSADDREQFFSEPHVAALSVYAGDTRGPLTVPIWYQYRPGGEPWILTGPASRKARLIEATGFFSLMVERVEPTTRYVTVDGAVSSIEPGTDAHLEEMTVAISAARRPRSISSSPATNSASTSSSR